MRWVPDLVWGEKTGANSLWWVKLTERGHLEYLVINEKTILKCTSR
jgi:hypothetical protein